MRAGWAKAAGRRRRSPRACSAARRSQLGEPDHSGRSYLRYWIEFVRAPWRLAPAEDLDDQRPCVRWREAHGNRLPSASRIATQGDRKRCPGGALRLTRMATASLMVAKRFAQAVLREVLSVHRCTVREPQARRLKAGRLPDEGRAWLALRAVHLASPGGGRGGGSATRRRLRQACIRVAARALIHAVAVKILPYARYRRYRCSGRERPAPDVCLSPPEVMHYGAPPAPTGAAGP